MTDRQLLDIFSREARIKRSFDSLDESVVRQIRYVRCYFLAKDGSGNAVYNMWYVDDLVRCQTFNMQQQEREGGVNSRDIPSEKEGESYSRQQNTFWWRKVTAVSSEPVTIDGRDYHWFDVAYNYDEESRATGNTSWCALGSDIPCAGDNACQFGNTGNPERMNAISIEINGAGNSDAPAIKVYRGIYTFSLKKCWWGGESTRKGMWSPSAGFEVYAPLFKFITEYGTYRETINRGSWLSIEREQDDYGNSVQYEGDDEPTQLVRKCYYYNQVSHKGSIWLCTMANDDFHWVDAYGHYISDSDYSELTDEQKARCTRVQNYTTDEPSETSPAWTKQVSKGTGIKTMRSYYAKTAEALVMPRDDGSVTWLESLSALGDIKEGWYVWTKNVTTYTDTIERTTTYTVSRWGIDGDGIHNIETKFYEDSRLLSQSQLAALAENKWVEYASLSLTKGDYIYTRVKITYDKNQTPTISYTVNRIGADGVSYITTEEYYCLGDSRTTPPAKHPYTRTDGKPEKMTPAVMQSRMNGGAWSESRPDYDTSTAESRAKKYLWNFEVGYDTTTQVQVTQPMCVGNYEKGIQSIVELYAISAYAVAPQQGGYPQDITAWTDEAHDCAPTDEKPYQWNKTVTTYSDGSQDVFYHVSAVKGTKGESIKKTAETYRYATNNTGTRPAATSSDWKTTKPTLNKGYWLYTETTITWSDGSKTVLYTDERNPNDGIAGQDIIVDGSTVITYCVSDTNTQQPADSNFKPYSQVTPEKGKWLWMKATTYYRKAGSAEGAHDAGSSSNYTVSYIALDGSAGRGISRITEYYKATDSSAEMAVPTSDSGWTTNPNNAGWSKEKKYLWNYEKVEYNKGTTVERTKPQILAIWTKDGKGIDSITNYYKITNSLTPPLRIHEGGTGWDDNPMVPTADSPYLWNYEVITYTEGDPTYTDVQQIGHYGKDGTNSPYLKSHTIMYALNNDGNTAPASGWGTALLKPSATNKYLWRKDIYEYDANDRGRNLMRGTSDFNIKQGTGQTAYWSNGEIRQSGGAGSITKETSDIPLSGIESYVVLTAGDDGQYGMAQDRKQLEAGKLTMSCYVRGNSGVTGFIQPIWHPGKSYQKGQTHFTCNGEWMRVVCTVEVPEETDNTFSIGYVYLNAGQQGKALNICGIKIEHGESVTDWVPAPEDLYREEVSIWSVYGEDGVGLTVNPSTLIFEEKKNDNSKYIDYSNNTVSIQYREGRTLKALTAVKNTQSGISESGWSITGSGTTTVTVTIGSGIQSTVTSGYVEVKLSAGAFSQTIRIPFYVNRVATWQQTIEDGVETSVAKKLSYSMGEDSVSSLEEVGKYIRGYKENISQLSRAVEGKNLIRELIRGWVSYDGKTETVSYGKDWSISDSSSDLYSPVILLSAGTQYCFSAYFEQSPDGDSAYAIEALSPRTYADGSALYNSPYTATPTITWYQVPGTSRYYFTFRTGSTDMLFVFNYFVYRTLRKPQLEVGSTPTEFAVTNYEVSSQIKQTADEIMAEVSGKASKSELKMTADEIKLSVNRGMRNYILRPKATDATSDSLDNFEKIEVSDPLMGQVVQIYWSGLGFFQLIGGFDKDNRSDLTNQTVTCYMVVKPVSTGTTQIKFGVWGNSDSQKSGLVIALATAAGTVNKVESIVSGAKTGMIAVGNGWYLCWATFNAGNIFSGVEGTAGINSINGSRWQVYGYGVLLGSSCPTLEAIITDTGLRSTGIDIEDGKITLRGDRVTFSNSTGTVSNKIYIDSTTGTLHATDGNFEGEITSTSGTIGGFTIDDTRLYNSNWKAGIDISYDNGGKVVKIGKNAQGASFTEDAIIRAENTKAKSQTTDTYNTALYLNASGARYNYAFYGKGNGVLNGLMFGFRIQTITCSTGNVPTFNGMNKIILQNGSFVLLHSTTIYSGGHMYIGMPTLSAVRNSLGLHESGTSGCTPFAIEITIIDQTRGEHEVHLCHRTTHGNFPTWNTSELPWRMSEDNSYYDDGEENMLPMGRGDIIKALLVYDETSVDYSGRKLYYRSYLMIRRY